MKKLFTPLLFLLANLVLNGQTTITLQPDAVNGKDADVASHPNAMNLNYGTFDKISPIAWTISGTPNTLRSLIAFDFSSIPANATITSAKLSLYFNPNYPAYDNSGSNALYIERVAQAWNESTVTWNNQPTTTTLNRVSIPASTASNQDYLDIDITQLSKDIFTDLANNNGFMIKLQDEVTYKSVMMCSSDYPNAAKRPKLEITYIVNLNNCITLQPDAVNGKDADVASHPNAMNSNYGAFDKISPIAWTIDGTPNTLRSLIAFDFSSIPANATITSAKLSLYFNPNYPAYDNSGSNALYIERVAQAWNESTVTWNNQPTTTTLNRVSIPASTASNQDYLDIDITQLSKDIFTDLANNNGFMIKLQDEVTYKSVMMCSSDYPNAAKRPKLEICYSVPSTSTSIFNSNELNTSTVFPNPFNTSAKISLSNKTALNNPSITVLNSNGVEVKNIQFNVLNNEIEFNRNGLSEGVYMYIIKQNNELISTGKFIIIN